MQPFAHQHRKTHNIHHALPVDADGFLLDPADWDECMACLMAAMDGNGTLEPAHWSVIYYLREHFLTYHSLPPVSQICRTHDMDKEAIRRLFGNCRSAWRTAGLPNPGPEALAYMT
jgi:TusE/DsrC/DsvC family sulfur relay protein